jgi:hypothetical protein
MKGYCNVTISLALGLLGLLILAMGCSNERVIIEKNPPNSSSPPPDQQVKKGPPPWAPAHGYRAKYQYRYYPSAYVYFDIGRKLYFYYDGGGWRVSASLPLGIQIEVSDYVILEMDTEQPYQYHAEVVKRYPPGQQKKSDKKKDKPKWN